MAGAGGGSHTMVVGPGFDGYEGAGYGTTTGRYDAGYGGTTGGYDRGGAGRLGSAFAGLLRGDGADGEGVHGAAHGGEPEPFLQRWLFSRRFVYVAAAVIALLLFGGGGWWLTSGRYAPVPAVAKMTAASAERALKQAGFQVKTGASVIDDNVPKDEVISTSPSGRALPGATIVLTISKGPKMIVIPQIPSGDTAAQAITLLRGAGLTVNSTPKQVGVASNPVIGQVAGTTPAAGTSVPENQPVSVNVVAGLTLPNLVNQDINSIQAWAGANHITIAPTNVDSDKPQGIIVSQSIPAGTPVQPGATTVNVTVSNGPPEVTFQDMRGQPYDQVKAQLEQLGFKVVGKHYFFGNKVFSTSPSGQAPAGSTITVYYGGF
jgi:serine/threonine-protein kinase